MTALTVSLPMVWIVAKAGLPLTLLAFAFAAALFFIRSGAACRSTERAALSVCFI